MTLGEKLRRARQDRGLTQTQVAGDVITRNMLSQIENDLAMPSVRTLEYLANVLGVEIGTLMCDDDKGGTIEQMRRARACYRTGDFAGCLEILRRSEEDDEALLLIGLCASELAQQALREERFADAEELARRADDACAQGLYATPQVLLKTARVLLSCAERQNLPCDDAAKRLQQLQQRFGSDAPYHLAMARYHLLCGRAQEADRELLMIGEPSEEDKAEYLILRGRIAASERQYEKAVLDLLQAERIGDLPRVLRRELYAAMELCSRETEDFKNAYLYAAKQLEL